MNRPYMFDHQCIRIVCPEGSYDIDSTYNYDIICTAVRGYKVKLNDNSEPPFCHFETPKHWLLVSQLKGDR